MRIAVVGGGISGNLAARLLATRHDVELFESAHYFGGHTNTVDVELDGQTYPVDTGFMVFNDRTYPNFCRMLELLEVPAQDSDMSFSVRCDRTGLEYQGGSLRGLFADRRNLLRPRFLKMLRDILTFNRTSLEAVKQQSIDDQTTVGQFLDQCRLGTGFREHYLLPMAGAIWSARPESILDFPAMFLVGFYKNHGLLQIRNRPQWRTIVRGARNYVSSLLEPMRDRVHLNSPVSRVQRLAEGVQVEVNGEVHQFDEVVMATHASQTRGILVDATPDEDQVLSAFPYQMNDAVLHTDDSLLPKRKAAWASWNYLIGAEQQTTVSVTYDLSRLQNHASSTPILLTLNRSADIAPEKVIRSFKYDHPAYSRDSAAAQLRHGEVSGANRVHFCGAYWGFGFHEDGVKSALAVARHFDLDIEALASPVRNEVLDGVR